MNIEMVPERLRAATQAFSNEVRRLMLRLESGEISPDAWQEIMRQLLARYHVSGMMAGIGSTDLPLGAEVLLNETLAEQYGYLKNFHTVVLASPEYNPAWLSRALMYALSIKTSYWEGDVYRQAGGQFLPLPAMPAQGTTCKTYCGCGWKVVIINGDKGAFDCYWERHRNDSCQTCLQRAEDWNPLRIRDGMIITPDIKRRYEPVEYPFSYN